jgi:hypothetical protein
VDIPHPHAIYFGVDNYRVGFEAGELLADYAINEWKGKVAWALGLDIFKAGPIVQSRDHRRVRGYRTETTLACERPFSEKRHSGAAGRRLFSNARVSSSALERTWNTDRRGNGPQRFGCIVRGA